MLIQLALIVSGLFGVGATLMTLAHRRNHVDERHPCADWLKYGVYAVIVLTMLLAAFVSRWLLAALLLGITIAGSCELKRVLKNRIAWPLLAAFSLGVAIKCALGHLLLTPQATWFPWFAFVFLLVAISDSFAQLWGQLLGRHKLCPRLSPGKTVEGFVGGFITTCLCALAIAPLLGKVSATQAAVLGCTIAVAAPAGDLAFSLIKRTLAIKDFSGLIPGHGGIFDRFDSLIVAAPTAYWCGRLIGI